MTSTPKVALITGITGQDCITVLLLGPVEKGGLPAEMVEADLAQAKQHALLKANGYSVNVNIE